MKKREGDQQSEEGRELKRAHLEEVVCETQVSTEGEVRGQLHC